VQDQATTWANRLRLDPPQMHRPVPMYWWSGAAPERPKLRAHLDALARLGIGGTIVTYSHLPDGRVDFEGSAPFTPEWWTLFRWFCDESASRQMTVGLCDYNLIGDALLDAGSHTPGCFGALNVVCCDVDPVATSSCATSWSGKPLAAVVTDGNGQREVAWRASTEDDTGPQFLVLAKGVSHVCFIGVKTAQIRNVTSRFDPTHPDAANALIESLYEPFRRELGHHLGSTFRLMFQDELDFGADYPLWSESIERELTRLSPDVVVSALPLLWHDEAGSIDFRLRYKDVCVDLLERHYFRPIFDWHEAAGVSLVMDQISRGDLRVAQRHYVDYASTMRWYHSPGNDDPDLSAERSVAAFKISSSIARLNGRSRVWNEAHYGSGWGVTPDDIVKGLNVGYAAGATFYNPHAVYYTTKQSWWEWAAPDFALRPPWAEHANQLWSYAARCGHLLETSTSQAGVALLDVADDLAVKAGATRSPEVAAALLQALPAHGIDLDVVDSASLRRAVAVDGQLIIDAQRYIIVICPDLKFLRSETTRLLQEFCRQGGHILAVGGTPHLQEQSVLGTSFEESNYSMFSVVDIADCSPSETAAVVAKRILSLGCHMVEPVAGTAMLNKRTTGTLEFVWVTCLTTHEGRLTLKIGDGRPVVVWDPLRQSTIPVEVSPGPGDSQTIRFLAQERHAYLVCLDAVQWEEPRYRDPSEQEASVVAVLGKWCLSIVSGVDNHYADFGLPVGPMPIQSRMIEVSALLPESGLGTGVRETGVEGTGDDGSRIGTSVEEPSPRSWLRVRAGDGPYWRTLGPAQHSNGFEGPAAGTQQQLPKAHWSRYVMSLRAGVPDDPTLKDFLTGPHGLKGRCPDEFLLSAAVDEQDAAGDYWFATVAQNALGINTGSDMSNEPGDDANNPPQGQFFLHAGSRSPMQVWVDGQLVLDSPGIAAEFFPPWGLVNFEPSRFVVPVELSLGPVEILVKLRRESDQTGRAYAVLARQRQVSVPDNAGVLRWWAEPTGALPISLPEPNALVGWTVRAQVPPVAAAARVVVHGRAQAFVDGHEVGTTELGGGQIEVEIPKSVGVAQRVLTLNIVDSQGRQAGAVLNGPIDWVVTSGMSRLGSWVDMGLGDFSGIVAYTATFTVTLEPQRKCTVDLGDVRGTARVFVNGRMAGDLITAPWAVELSNELVDGENVLRIEVASGLAEHYRTFPTPYARPALEGTGLFGPVRVVYQ
jgi:hypothetical protein